MRSLDSHYNEVRFQERVSHSRERGRRVGLFVKAKNALAASVQKM